MPRSKEDFKGTKHQFYTFSPQNPPPPPVDGGGGHNINLQFLNSLPYRCFMPDLFKNGPVVLDKM